VNFTLIAYKHNSAETDGQGYYYNRYESDLEIECSDEVVCIIERWAGFLATKTDPCEAEYACTLLINGRQYTDWTDEEQAVATDIRHHAEIRAGQIRDRRAEEERIEDERRTERFRLDNERRERDQLLALQKKYAPPREP
jgi:hypothetical protein